MILLYHENYICASYLFDVVLVFRRSISMNATADGQDTIRREGIIMKIIGRTDDGLECDTILGSVINCEKWEDGWNDPI